jgi:hypothetical protein
VAGIFWAVKCLGATAAACLFAILRLPGLAGELFPEIKDDMRLTAGACCANLLAHK